MKNNKGITIISLVITIAILIILSGAVVSQLLTAPNTNYLEKLIQDLEVLKDKVSVYYNQYGELPTKGNLLALTGPNSIESNIGTKGDENNSLNAGDGDNYYELDISKLGGLTLNYGTGDTSNSDIYIINEQSGVIYYLLGIEYEGNTYHRLEQGEGIAPWLKVGDYVNYENFITSSTYTTDTIEIEKTGYGSQTFNTETGTKWRVLRIEGVNVILISENSLHGTVYGEGLYLEGAIGYNNAEEVLNAMCAKLYSSTSKGITARSVNGEDIDKLTGVSEWTDDQKNVLHNVGIGTTHNTSGYGTNNNIPDFHTRRKNTSGYSVQNSFDLTTTAYWYYFTDIDISRQDTTTEKLLFGDYNDYWLASRAVDADSDRAEFTVRVVGGSGGRQLSYLSLLSSIGYLYEIRFPVRAVITVPITQIEQSAVQNDKNNPHTIIP